MIGNTIRRLIRGKFTLLRDQKGFSLLEILMALGILGAIGGGFSAALYTGIRATDQAAEFTEVDRLVRNQIEEIKNASYDEILPLEYPIVATPGDYSISLGIVKTGDGDGGTYQTITITVARSGDTVWKIDTIKVKGL
jgi:prepilin-type N-terminal cleavage/methylation domain-containing protein